MRILLASANPYFPQHFGGIEANLDNLSRGLITRGHEIAILAGLSSGDLVWARNRVARRFLGFSRRQERFHGYRLIREWNLEKAVQNVAKSFAPDILVGHGGAGLDVFFTSGVAHIPTVAHLHGMPPLDHAKQLHDKGVRNYICCSNFVKSKLAERMSFRGLNVAVIYNAFNHVFYRAASTGRYVTLINPVQQKGVEIALKIAQALPEVPFLFVKGWRVSSQEFAPIERRIKSLRNVVIREPSIDMRQVYGQTRILIMPSQVDEGAGRVITEAHINGIPVIGSNIGGIPEVIGTGGLMLPHDDVPAWIQTLRELLQMPCRWKQLSDQARAQAEDGIFSYQGVLGAYEDFLRLCISRAPVARCQASAHAPDTA